MENEGKCPYRPNPAVAVRIPGFSESPLSIAMRQFSSAINPNMIKKALDYALSPIYFPIISPDGRSELSYKDSYEKHLRFAAFTSHQPANISPYALGYEMTRLSSPRLYLSIIDDVSKLKPELVQNLATELGAQVKKTFTSHSALAHGIAEPNVEFVGKAMQFMALAALLGEEFDDLLILNDLTEADPNHEYHAALKVARKFKNPVENVAELIDRLKGLFGKRTPSDEIQPVWQYWLETRSFGQMITKESQITQVPKCPALRLTVLTSDAYGEKLNQPEYQDQFRRMVLAA